MQFLVDFWLPIVVSAVFVFIVSAIIHMVLPHHKSEFRKLANEDAVMSALSTESSERYMFPFPDDMKQMSTPEFQERQAKGPNGTVIIHPGPVNMGKNLLVTFVFYLVVGLVIAYVCFHTQSASWDYLHRFRIAGAVAFAAHGLGWMSYFIWYRWGRFWPNFFDSVVYALVTAGTFGWLWPKP